MTQTQMWTKPADTARRKSQGGKLFQMLKDSFDRDIRLGMSSWLERNWLEDTSGTHNFTARISELRGEGHVIENKRIGDRSYYRYNGTQDAPTTQIRQHCPTCRCGQ